MSTLSNTISKKRHAVTIAIIVIALIIGCVIGYIIGVGRHDDSTPGNTIYDARSGAEITIKDDNVSVEEPPPEEDPPDEELPDDSLQNIPWQFYPYEDPDLASMNPDASPPDNVQIIEKDEGVWTQTEKDGDEYWEYIEKNLYYIDRWVSLYLDIGDENAIEDLRPQIVEIVDQKDNWLQISTEIGDMWVDPNSVRQSVRLDVPSYNQTESGYPLGCELVSLAMMMNYETEVDINDLYNDLPRADNPYEGFRGDPASSTRGWTIFPPALSGMMIKYLGSSYDMSNLEMEDLREQLNTNTPILVWIRGLGWPVHALCLSGYDESGFFYNDPWTGEKDVFITYDDFYEIWNEPIYDSVLNLTYTPRKALSYYPGSE